MKRMLAHWPQWRWFQASPRFILAVGSLTALAVVLSTAWDAWRRYEATLDAATRSIHTVATLATEHAARALHGIEDALDGIEGVAKQMKAEPGKTPDELHESLKSLNTVSQVYIGFALFDAEGRQIGNSRTATPEARPAVDQEHFRVHLDGTAKGIHFAAPSASGGDGTWRFHVTRALREADGALSGVVAVEVNPDFFARLYRTLDLGAAASLSILREDGTVMAHATDAGWLGRKVLRADLVQGLAPGNDTHLVHGAGLFSGEAHITGLRRLEDRGLAIAVSVRRDGVLAPFMAGLRFDLVRVLLIVGAIGIGTVLLAAQVRRQACLQEALVAAHAEAVAATREAEEALAVRTRFIASMSHEIRTPLNAIIGYGQLLAATPLEPVARTRAARMVAAGRSLLRLIDDILDFSKIQAGDISVHATAVDPRAAIENQIEVIRLDAEEKRLTITVTVADDVPALLYLDGDRFQQVLLNLLTNAIKFTREGGVVLRCGLSRQADGEASLEVVVADTGIGMSPEQLDRVFRPFERVREINVPGTGLGLTIVRTIVDAMGGSIDLASRHGCGTTVTLHLPVTVPTAEQAAAPAAPPPVAAAEPGAVHVLLAEDDPRNAEIAEAFLAMAGISVTIARNGREAVDLALAHPFAAILMDVQMPVMDGLEAARAIRAASSPAHCATVPIIALTAYASRADRQECLDAGMTDFVTKPIDREQLLGVLQQWQVLRRFDQQAAAAPAAPPAAFFDQPRMDALAAILPPERLAAVLRESLVAAEEYLAAATAPGNDDDARRVAFHNLVSIFGNIALATLSETSRSFESALKRGQPIAPAALADFLEQAGQGRQLINRLIEAASPPAAAAPTVPQQPPRSSA
ncbi:MAG: hypothetical protein OHK0024_06830 [Thalassobaculales bacterium]